jgi:hypothetical protein
MKKTAIIALIAISAAGTSHAWGPTEQAGLAGLFLGAIIGHQVKSNSEQQPNVVYQQPYQQPNVVYQQQPNVVYQQQPNVVYQQQQPVVIYQRRHAPHMDRLPRGWCGVLGQDQYGNRVSVPCN